MIEIKGEELKNIHEACRLVEMGGIIVFDKAVALVGEEKMLAFLVSHLRSSAHDGFMAMDKMPREDRIEQLVNSIIGAIDGIQIK